MAMIFEIISQNSLEIMNNFFCHAEILSATIIIISEVVIVEGVKPDEVRTNATISPC